MAAAAAVLTVVAAAAVIPAAAAAISTVVEVAAAGSYVSSSLTVGTLTAGYQDGDGLVEINLIGGPGTTFHDTGMIQQYTILTTGVYQFIVDGAQGGGGYNGSGGLGAQMIATGTLTAGTTLDIVVGGQGQSGMLFGGWGGGGGGGSFVYTAAVPEPSTFLVAAVGAGGLILYGWSRRKRRA